MSPSSRTSDLAQLREALLHLNSELFLTIGERRSLCLKIQEYKDAGGRYANYDPEREKEVFTLFTEQLKACSTKELLAFSLIMEDQAVAMAPGSYPTWSNRVHLANPKNDLFEMINPLILKFSHPEFFNRLTLAPDFAFLKDF